MTQVLDSVSALGARTQPVPRVDRAAALVDLADAWLTSEMGSVKQPGRVELVGIAGGLALAYEEALASASPEQVRLAWERAVARQARHPVGSAPWWTAFRVAELLRFEYLAIPSDRKHPRAVRTGARP